MDKSTKVETFTELVYGHFLPQNEGFLGGKRVTDKHVHLLLPLETEGAAYLFICALYNTKLHFSSKECPWWGLQTAVIIPCLGRPRALLSKKLLQQTNVPASEIRVHEGDPDFGLYFCCWENALSTVSSCLALVPGQHLPVARQGFSCSVGKELEPHFALYISCESLRVLGTSIPRHHP